MKKIYIRFLALIFFSCNSINRNDFNESDINYIKGLGLLEDTEEIIWFDTQLSLKKSGNFLSSKRLAAYFLVGNEQEKYREFAYLNEIDSISLIDKSKSITYSSFIEVYKKNGEIFNVYIDQDSLIIKEYYNKALKMLDKSN